MSLVVPFRKTILCDLDGCLIAGGVALPGASELVAEYGDRLVVVSNNSTDTPLTLAARLADLGLEIPANRIVLAGTTALDLLAKERPGARVAVFGSTAIKAYAQSAGLILVEAHAELVFLARDIGFSYEQLSRVANMLRSGASLFVANLDTTHPDDNGGIVPETGALLAAVAACLPDLRYRCVGKPDEALFRIALEVVGANACEALFVGDNPDTDGEGARRMEMSFAHIGSDDFPTVRELVHVLRALNLAPAESSPNATARRSS